ncbi:uncharacterized protein LOC142628921 [Castanea sativa]|uniref:uncharacterized protein LOC142628921 n=1 Tax=Castanea sativa TaxID=21020 RepID=UPI003F6501B4
MGEFMEWEIQEALNQMAPLKAPGPDGMPPLFYQHFWGIMNGEATSTILVWLNSGKLPYPINHTFVTLIPKVKNPVSVSQYCPISLCNVLYKIFSKVLAKRLKKFMPDLITEHQSAFAKNRLISDNVLVAFETLHCMKNHNSGQTGFMALKLDMSKAYDKVEWNYLQKLLEKMGFCSRWIGLIMECVRTVSYSILVNGDPKGLINPTRGIRQGDPLSPFLFLLCIEGLHGLIKRAARVKVINGFSICKRGRGKKASFNYIKERVWRKLQGWEGKLLSQASREVLIKAIAQAIPTYAMGCFKLPLSLCHEIEAMVKKFFWGQQGDKRKVHWVKWSELTKSKLEGGLGFRELALFNDSLLAKQAWQLLHNEGTLFYRIFKARFFPNSSFMEAKELATGSYAWKSILKGREVIQLGARFRVGNGKSVKIWQHHWLPIKHPPLISSPIIESMENATVDCLMDNNTSKWDAEAEAELAHTS